MSTVYSGQSYYVYAPTTATSTFVLSGGFMEIYAGGVASSTYVYGGHGGRIAHGDLVEAGLLRFGDQKTLGCDGIRSRGRHSAVPARRDAPCPTAAGGTRGATSASGTRP